MSHRASAPTHDESRSLVCLICGEKGSCKISPSLLETIRSHLLPTYDPSDPFLPCAICSTHQKALSDLRRGHVDRRIVLQDLSKYHSVRWTRGSCVTESCAICSTARNNPVGKCGPTNSKRRCRTRPSFKEDSTPSKVCPSCFGRQSKGITHKCFRTTKLENTLRTLSPKSKEKLCSTVLKDRNRQDGTRNRISLATTSGKNLHVSLLSEPSDDEKEAMSTEELCKLQVDTNLSDK